LAFDCGRQKCYIVATFHFFTERGPNLQDPETVVFHLFVLGTLDAFNTLRRYLAMDNWTFGVTMMVVGMGGTILTLWIMSLIMSLLGKLFPYRKEEE
jgi:hypothetical protein